MRVRVRVFGFVGVRVRVSPHNLTSLSPRPLFIIERLLIAKKLIPDY